MQNDVSPKVLTALEVSKLLRVSKGFVYRNKRELGGFQACRGGKLLFFENEILNRIRSQGAILRQEVRQVPGNQDDQRQAKEQDVQNQGRSKAMGRSADRRGLVEQAKDIGLTLPS